ncbi:MAG: bifunctional phosphopantothenoylcysteine decarboxylase/phosphopantothenate--cysteine ligase CoaBC [Spirochaetia bacterium]|nr:bifunctional phosphopantothenoylcysteine decarboxylase/phosphopantothenate--cysteine ligase CoaBC [Spirochaetia bacterium]
MAKVLLGVASSISIYKSLEVLSLLKKAGHDIFPILTDHAAKLVAPALFTSLAGKNVERDMFAAAAQGEMNHIRLAKDAALFLICPATANLIAKLVAGFADDLLTTTLLCSEAPVLIAPAMNPTMWNQEVVRENVKLLKERGYIFVEPDEGLVACGDYGQGKLASVERIAAAAMEVLSGKNKVIERMESPHSPKLSKLRGKRVIVTAGGSQEPLDPVRVITNLSSGKMAFHLAEELRLAGAEVEYLYGHITSPLPNVGSQFPFSTALELQSLLQRRIGTADMLIMAAAPGDFRAERVFETKIKRNGEKTIRLIPNPDILASLPRRAGQVFVGFAAETDDLLQNATDKLKRKNLDLIVANTAVGKNASGEKFVGMGEDFTEFSVLGARGVLVPRQTASKADAARMIVEKAAEFL